MTATLSKPRIAAALDHELVIDSFAGGGEGLASRFALLRVVAFPASMPDFRRRPHDDSEAPRRVFEGARK